MFGGIDNNVSIKRCPHGVVHQIAVAEPSPKGPDYTRYRKAAAPDDVKKAVNHPPF
jgi:hypothetical protein